MATFTAEKEENGIVRLTLVGDLDEESLHDLRAWTDETTELLRSEYAERGAVPILANLAGVSGYHPAAMAYLADFIRTARQYCSHVATCGESPSVHFAKEVVMRMANRHDIESCDTEEAARAWLLAQQEEVPHRD